MRYKLLEESLVYIISVNFNAAEHTIEMINSLKDIEYKNYRIVVVDNGSNFSDYKKLKQIEDSCILIRSEVNLGFSGGNNIGIKRAIEDKAEYILLLNNDTIVKKSFLNKLVESMVENDADLVCPKILNYYNKEIINYAGGDIVAYKGAVNIYGLGEHDSEKYNCVKNITFAHGCCLLISTEVLIKVGGLEDSYFLYFEDTDLSAKLNLLGKRMIYEPKSIIYHKESVSTKKFSDNYQYYFCRNRLQFIKRNIKYPVKIIALLYTALYMLKHLLYGDFKSKNCICAIRDFKNQVLGKREEKAN